MGDEDRATPPTAESGGDGVSEERLGPAMPLENAKLVASVGVLAMALIVAVCAGGVWFAESATAARERRERDARERVLGLNDHRYRVLGIYSEHNPKGHFTRHVAVCEGMADGKRIEVPARPELPVVGEVWSIAADGEGYRFVGRVR